jgi:hypothetical protein
MLEAITSRKIEFTGQHKPVKWACRAPMPNGKLCERRDRFKVNIIIYNDEKNVVLLLLTLDTFEVKELK